MSERMVTIYSVERILSTAGANLELGYEPTTFEVVADSEAEAVRSAMQKSRWDRKAFAWRVTGSRVVVVSDEA